MMKKRKSQSGVALFMVISAVALLAILLSELTYSTQINSRMAYNYVDNLKAYYLAKAGLKLSLMRLKAYKSIKATLGKSENKQFKDVIPADLIEKTWNMPFIYPLPILKEATQSETDAIKKFTKDSKLQGSFTAAITGQSTRLNINNLMVKAAKQDTDSSTPATPGTGQPSTGSTKPTSDQDKPVDFTAVLEPAISQVLERKKDQDKDFSDAYRNVSGKDIVDAMKAYLFKDSPPSNLPGFKPFKAKEAPFYSLSELHLIPGLDDDLYNLIEPLITVYSTPGINVNTIDKKGLWALIPELTEDDVDTVIRNRDDEQQGKKFNTADEFWTAIQGSSAGKSIDRIKERFAKANIKPLTDEESFKIGVQASVGMSTRTLEAYVALEAGAKDTKKPSAQPTPGPGQPQPQGPDATKNDASAKKATGLNLMYWRIL